MQAAAAVVASMPNVVEFSDIKLCQAGFIDEYDVVIVIINRMELVLAIPFLDMFFPLFEMIKRL